MKTLLRIARAILIGATVCLPVPVCSAGTIVHSGWLPDLPFGTLPSDPSWGYSVPHVHAVFVPYFDDLGATRTLTSVKLELEADTKGGNNTFDNESATSGTVTVAIGVNAKMSGPSGLTTSVDAVHSATGFVTADSDPFAPDFIGSDSFSVSGSFVYNDAVPKTITTGLTPYLGPFDIPFSFEGITSTVGTSTGGLLGSNKVDYGDIKFGGFYKVTYTYVATIPEPSTFAMASLGILAVVLVIRRNGRSSARV